jgi:hypothetical protein
MAQFKESGYLFLQSYDLDEKDIRCHLKQKIKNVEKDTGSNISQYKLYINVVSNKENKKLGYTYVWTDKKEIYNIFCGLNLDGTERIRYYDDPNWEEEELNDDKKLSEISDWGDLAQEEDKAICPQLKEYLPPLTDIFNYEEGGYELRIGAMVIKSLGKNVIYSKNLDDWINEKIINHHIGFFEKDKKKYKNHKTGKLYQYPQINNNKNEKKGNTVTIVFSPRNPFTASFLINIIKKIRIKHNNNEKLIFFSQSKN